MRYLLFQGVDDAAENTPNAPAISYNGNSITYEELSHRSSNLAQVLVAHGIKRGDRVGIYMNKSAQSAVALYGIMKAGGAYVPLDPFAPVSRTAYVIKDCGIHHLVTDDSRISSLKQIYAEGSPLQHLIGVQKDVGLPIECTTWDEVYAAASTLPISNLTEQDLAYIIYTSGSTGMPKGIMHTHRSGLSFAEWGAKTYGLTSSDRLSNHAPLHFDLSTFDFFAAAIAGAATVIIPEALTKFPTNMAKFIQEEKITVWYSVPFALIQLVLHGKLNSYDYSAVRWILFAGEVFPTKHLRQLMAHLPHVRFCNLYGPTETNVCTYYIVDQLPEDPNETIPIGKPCENVEDLVFDIDNNSVSPGEVGELLIRGGVVMKGYWGQPEKTQKGFFHRPVFDQFEDLFYRTGDLVYLDNVGNYRYLGRKDRQIKTRGYRVELDEVEVALLSHPGVEEAAVYSVPDGNASNLIEAAVILTKGSDLIESDLIGHLTGRLPSYAIPVRIDILASLPRTTTGKIDRRELQALPTDRTTSKLS
jgi:amino acid adenylation domain-containing protein